MSTHKHTNRNRSRSNGKLDQPVFREYATGAVTLDAPCRHGHAARLTVGNDRITVQREPSGRVTVRTHRLVSVYKLRFVPDVSTLAGWATGNL